jgi:hypothetical protein
MRRHRALAVIAAILIPFTSPARGELPVHRVGVLSSSPTPEYIQAWEARLRDYGYVVGSNLQIEYRFFQGRTERIPTLLAELVAFGPEVIVTGTAIPRPRSTALLQRSRWFSSLWPTQSDLVSSKAWRIRAAM